MRFFCILLSLVATAALSAADEDFARFVNPWIGTEGTGHTTVAAADALGMVQPGPDTGTESWDYASGYRNSDTKLYGFSQNHLNGTGVPELGDLLILPFPGSHPALSRLRRSLRSGDTFPAPTPARASPSATRFARGIRSPVPFDKSSETASPGYYAVTLESGIRCEAAASPRCAIWRFTYPDGANARLLVDMQWGLVWEKMDEHVKCANVEISTSKDHCPQLVTGWAETKSWTERRWNFALEADAGFAVVKGDGSRRFALDFGKAKTVTVRIALSTTDEDGARRNLAEVRGRTLEQVAAAARAAWNGYLSRVEVPGADAATETNVYTALYHLFWQPNDITDIDGRYRGADGRIAKVGKGRRYFSTLSLWDTYRAAHPLYTILAPELVDDFVRSMVAHRKAVGHLPVWPLWGRDTHCMIGNHAVPVLVEAVKKNLTTLYDEEVFEAICATLGENHEGKPKENWPALDKYGWYPFDLEPEESVSRTLEGAYDDWCASRLAARLEDGERAAFFSRRAEAWKNVFDPTTKCVRGRKSDGTWREPFDPAALYAYGEPRDISEASANQYMWHVQQDPAALAEALGGRSAALAKLEEHFDPARAPHGNIADVTGLIGEYAHGNEPGHHVLYLFTVWGRPERAAEIVREIFDRFYRPAPDGLCGNDDCGQMSAWYLFSAMGFYPFEPTGGEYVFGAPQVPKVTIRLGNGKSFTVIARNLSKENRYVKSVTLNGRRIPLSSFSHWDVVRGGELVFEMSGRPSGDTAAGRTDDGDVLRSAQESAARFAEKTAARTGDARLARMFVSSFLDTITRTVRYGTKNGRDDAFVVTGDIPAMWLRDSCAQVWPYLPLAREDEAMRRVLRGVLNRAFDCIRADPYANAFLDDGESETMWADDMTEMKRGLHERKWELDSLCYPLRLAHGYWKATGDAAPFGEDYAGCVRTVLSTLRAEQRASRYSFKRRTWTPYGTLADGKSAPFNPNGMVASAFRPSDDACLLPFNVPGNIFARDVLSKTADVLRETGGDAGLAADCDRLSAEIGRAVEESAVFEHPTFGRVYAYEVDGFGGRIFMDDANAPSLLSLAYLCDAASFDRDVYEATRRMVLSEANPWFVRGTSGEGVGSPHTGRGRIWPLAVALRALTTTDRSEIAQCLAQLVDTTGGTGALHESHAADDDGDFTRGWFAWADGLFAEAVLHALDTGVDFNPAIVEAVRRNAAKVLRETCAKPARASVPEIDTPSGDSTVGMVRESLVSPVDERAARLVETLRADGTWPDVPYARNSASAWGAADHVKRMVELARARHTPGVVDAFRRALGHWAGKGYRNKNWWWNQIGVPLELGRAGLLMGEDITRDERRAIASLMRESRIGMTGQNRIWLAECVLMRSLLEGNAEGARAAREAILGEVVVSRTVEGIQSDWSFHQHGNQAQFGNYGLSYILTVPRLADMFEGTPLAFPAESREILRNLVARGFAPTVWKGAMDVGAIGRQLNKGAARIKGAGVLVAAGRLGVDADGVAKGLHWFPKSAYGVYRADGWMASVKCETKSIRGTEVVNEDNMLGAHLADGALFSSVTGDEYRDIFPLWNWRHIPGTTSYDVESVDWKSRNRAEAAERDGDTVRFRLDRAGLTAETTWHFSPQGVEVEVTDITATNGLPVVTTVEQSLARPNAAWRREGDGIVAVNGAIRYFVPSNAVVRIEARTGSWRRHMGAAANEEARGRVFEITIPHGVDPSGASCAWRTAF